MSLLAIPNVSEGADPTAIAALRAALEGAAARVLDVHSDAVHNRTVFTLTAEPDTLVEALTNLALAAKERIDLTRHHGVHPRVGVVDVCPIVPHGSEMDEAVDLARRVGSAIAERAGLPVYFYGRAAVGPELTELPALRKGGLEGLIARARSGVLPDAGPHDIDPRSGVVCVGARGPLIAFNVWLAAPVETARDIAEGIRGRDGIRALGLRIDEQTSQVSMNLTDPERRGVDAAFGSVQRLAQEADVEVVATELVGLVPERFLPTPDAQAARLLLVPGRSVESVLKR